LIIPVNLIATVYNGYDDLSSETLLWGNVPGNTQNIKGNEQTSSRQVYAYTVLVITLGELAVWSHQLLEYLLLLW